MLASSAAAVDTCGIHPSAGRLTLCERLAGEVWSAATTMYEGRWGVAVQNVLRTCKGVQQAQCRRALEERGVREQPGWPLPLTLFLSYYLPPS